MVTLLISPGVVGPPGVNAGHCHRDPDCGQNFWGQAGIETIPIPFDQDQRAPRRILLVWAP